MTIWMSKNCNSRCETMIRSFINEPSKTQVPRFMLIGDPRGLFNDNSHLLDDPDDSKTLLTTNYVILDEDRLMYFFVYHDFSIIMLINTILGNLLNVNPYLANSRIFNVLILSFSDKNYFCIELPACSHIHHYSIHSIEVFMHIAGNYVAG